MTIKTKIFDHILKIEWIIETFLPRKYFKKKNIFFFQNWICYNSAKNENIEVWSFANILFLLAIKDSSIKIGCYRGSWGVTFHSFRFLNFFSGALNPNFPGWGYGPPIWDSSLLYSYLSPCKTEFAKSIKIMDFRGINCFENTPG